MDTKSLIAILCIVIAMVILLSLTIYTVITSWRKISREYDQRQGCPAVAQHSYENMECVQNEHAASDQNFTDKTNGKPGTSSQYEEIGDQYDDIASDRCPTAGSANGRAEVACTHSSQSGKNLLVHVETKDTSF